MAIFHSILLAVSIINVSFINGIILKCHPSLSPFNGKLKGTDSAGGLNFVPILSVPHLSVPVYRLCKSLMEIRDVVKMMQQMSSDRVLQRKFTPA